MGKTVSVLGLRIPEGTGIGGDFLQVFLNATADRLG